MEKYYTYIIESITSGRWYYGYTSDLEKRLSFHNEGSNISTRKRGPWKYIFIRSFDTKDSAAAFEKLLKKSKNKEYIKRAYSDHFIQNR